MSSKKNVLLSLFIEYITKFVCVAVRTEPPSIEDKEPEKNIKAGDTDGNISEYEISRIFLFVLTYSLSIF